MVDFENVFPRISIVGSYKKDFNVPKSKKSASDLIKLWIYRKNNLGTNESVLLLLWIGRNGMQSMVFVGPVVSMY